MRIRPPCPDVLSSSVCWISVTRQTSGCCGTDRSVAFTNIPDLAGTEAVPPLSVPGSSLRTVGRQPDRQRLSPTPLFDSPHHLLRWRSPPVVHIRVRVGGRKRGARRERTRLPRTPRESLNLQNWLLELRECFPFKQTVLKMAES